MINDLPFEARVLTDKEFAEYLRVEIKYLRYALMQRAGMPKPFYLPGSGRDTERRRWRGRDVLAYVDALAVG
jgi:hypothetical protein